MDIQIVNISKLNPAAYNPRKDLQPGDAEYDKLERSINTFGCVEPIVWNSRTGNVVGGHQCLKILIAKGAKFIEERDNLMRCRGCEILREAVLGDK